MSGSMMIGVDVGGTKTEAVLIAGGSVVRKVRLASGFGPEAVLGSTLDAITRVADGRQLSGATVGVGVPGAIDPATGTVSHAINLGLEHLDLGSRLAGELGCPVRIENDVNAATLGAFHLLGRPGSESMAYLNLGTGLAAGLVLRGELWRGSRGAAGEIGHILVDPAGPLDLDGQRGGLEAMASGSGVARQWGSHENAVTAVLDAAEGGDERAADIRSRLLHGIASAVRILVLTVDVEAVVVGGGISRLGARLMAGVHAVFDEWSSASPFITSLDLPGRMLLLPDDAPVAALGAARLGATPAEAPRG